MGEQAGFVTLLILVNFFAGMHLKGMSPAEGIFVRSIKPPREKPLVMMKISPMPLCGSTREKGKSLPVIRKI